MGIAKVVYSLVKRDEDIKICIRHSMTSVMIRTNILQSFITTHLAFPAILPPWQLCIPLGTPTKVMYPDGIGLYLAYDGLVPFPC